MSSQDASENEMGAGLERDSPPFFLRRHVPRRLKTGSAIDPPLPAALVAQTERTLASGLHRDRLPSLIPIQP